MNHFLPAKQQQNTSTSKKVSTPPETKTKVVATKRLTHLVQWVLKLGSRASHEKNPLGVSYSHARSVKTFGTTRRTFQRGLHSLEAAGHALVLKSSRAKKLSRFTQLPNRVLYFKTPINLTPQVKEMLKSGHLIEGKRYQPTAWVDGDGNLHTLDEIQRIINGLRCSSLGVNFAPLNHTNTPYESISSVCKFSPPMGECRGGGEDSKNVSRSRRTSRPAPTPKKSRPTPKAPQNSQKAPPRRLQAKPTPRPTPAQKNATSAALALYTQRISRAPISEAERKKFEGEFVKSGITAQTLLKRMQAIAEDFMLRQVTLSPNRVFHFDAMMRSAVFVRSRIKHYTPLLNYDFRMGLKACIDDIAITRWFFGCDKETRARALTELVQHHARRI